jgi:S-adenosylmethionine:diacylglycerol 3-amino-3-carboxypropyl transferase
MPVYLRKSTFERIKDALDKTAIRIKTAMITDVLEQCRSGSFDCYSLSDISSYLDQGGYCRLMQEVVRTSKPKSRICSRASFFYRELPEACTRYIKRNKSLEEKLALHDHSMVCEFIVGEVLCRE